MVECNLSIAKNVGLYHDTHVSCVFSHDEQAVARAYRFGQEKEVFVYRLQTFSTIEQHIFRINVHKSGISR